MSLMTEADREKLETLARERAAQDDISQAIVVYLRSYCLEHGIGPSDSELFVIVEDAIARRMKVAGSPAEHEQGGLSPRTLVDRRKGERRQRPRRTAGRRSRGVLALMEKFQRLGRPERRSGSDRRSGGDRREELRRKHVRRSRER